MLIFILRSFLISFCRNLLLRLLEIATNGNRGVLINVNIYWLGSTHLLGINFVKWLVKVIGWLRFDVFRVNYACHTAINGSVRLIDTTTHPTFSERTIIDFTFFKILWWVLEFALCSLVFAVCCPFAKFVIFVTCLFVLVFHFINSSLHINEAWTFKFCIVVLLHCFQLSAFATSMANMFNFYLFFFTLGQFRLIDQTTFER